MLEFLSELCGLLGQLKWLATQVIPQLSAPLSVHVGYIGVATVSTMLEANKLARRAMVWAQIPLLKPRSQQVGHLVRITNATFLEQAEWKVQAAADAEGELTYCRLSLWKIFGGTAPLWKWQELAAEVPATLVLDSRAVYDGAQRVIVPRSKRQTIRSCSNGTEEVVGRDTTWVTLDTFSSRISRLHDQRI